MDPGPPAQLKLTVVVPTFNRTEILRACLQRLESQTVSLREFEVIVVDDASSEPVQPLLEPVFRGSALNLRWMRIEVNNLSRARNLALEQARGELILFIGDDILAEPLLAEAHAGFHAGQPENVAVLCRIDPAPESRQTAFERFFNPFGFDNLVGDQEVDCRYFWTNNISLNTAFLRRNGWFDEDLPDANHEDNELGYRLQRAGLQILYRDRVVGYHHHRYTLKSACQAQYRRGFTYHKLRGKVPDNAFCEWLGLFSWRNRPRTLVRDLIRSALFNGLTAAAWLRWLSEDKESKARRYFYWKLLTYYTNKGYREGRVASAAGRP